MKKHNLLLVAGAIAVALTAGSANAAPAHGGHHNNMPQQHTVTHVYNAPRPGHGGHHNHHVVHNNHHHHHHHHHGASAGDLIIATAILISAIM